MKQPTSLRLLVCIGLFVTLFTILMTTALNSASAAPASPILVTTTAWRTRIIADGECSLFEALKAAELNNAVEACTSGTPGADIIQLPAGTFTATTTSVSLCINTSACAMPVVREDLTIQGAGIDLTTITHDGDDYVRLFFVDGATNGNIKLQLRDLALEGGVGGNTGFSGAGVGHAGGAIFAYAPAEIHAERVRFADNEAFNYGGAIYSTGAVVLTDTLFTNNHVAQSGGAIEAKHISVVNSEFVDNSATLSTTDGNGGAITVLDEGGSLTVRGSTFANNHALLGSAIFGRGLDIDGTLFSENTEVPKPGVSSFGGAIYACNGIHGHSISNSQFVKNAAEFGGAIATADCDSTITQPLNITNVIFDENDAKWGGADGAALYLLDAPAAVSNSTFRNHSGNVISIRALAAGGSSFDETVFANNFSGGNSETIHAKAAFMVRDSVAMDSGISFAVLDGSAAQGSLERVTIANNSGGGWVFWLRSNAQLTLRRVTVAHNNFNTSTYAGINAVAGTTVTLNNSVIANSGRDLMGAGTFTSEGGNVIGRNDATLTPQANDLVGTVANPVNALLAPLGRTGYSPWHFTAAPIPGSPAIDRIDASGDSPVRTVVPCQVGSLDQLGKPGDVDFDNDLIVSCDSGAHERQKTERYATQLGINSTTRFGATLVSIAASGSGGSDRDVATIVEVARYSNAASGIPAGVKPLPAYVEITGLGSGTGISSLTLELCYSDWEVAQSAVSAESTLTLWAFDGISWNNLGSGSLDTTSNCLTKAIDATATAYMLAEPGAPTGVQLQNYSTQQLLIMPRILGLIGTLISLTALVWKRK